MSVDFVTVAQTARDTVYQEGLTRSNNTNEENDQLLLEDSKFAKEIVVDASP